MPAKNKANQEYNETDWQGIYFAPSFQRLVDKLVVSRFAQSHLADSAKTHLLEFLFDPEVNRFAGYQGKGSPQGYLKVIVRNAVESYAQHKLGKKVPPTWIKEQGAIWIRVWQELCLERREREEIVTRFSYLGYLEDFTHEAMRRIKARIPRCGSSDYVELRDEMHTGVCDDTDIAPATLRYSKGETIETQIQRRDSEALLEVLARILEPEKLTTLQHDLTFAIEIPAQTQVVMKMALLSGMKLSAISRALGITRYHAEKELQQGLSLIRKAFENYGIDLANFEFVDGLDDLENA